MQVICVINFELTYITKTDLWEKQPYQSDVSSQFTQEMYRSHVCKVFLKWKYNRTMHQKPAFCASWEWNCQLMIHFMFYALLNGTSMFVDHENLGIDILISKMCWIFMEMRQKYYFPVMASTKWPPFCPHGKSCVAPYLKSLAMTKDTILPSFMLVPRNAWFFHISLGLHTIWPTRLFA